MSEILPKIFKFRKALVTPGSGDIVKILRSTLERIKLKMKEYLEKGAQIDADQTSFIYAVIEMIKAAAKSDQYNLIRLSTDNFVAQFRDIILVALQLNGTHEYPRVVSGKIFSTITHVVEPSEIKSWSYVIELAFKKENISSKYSMDINELQSISFYRSKLASLLEYISKKPPPLQEMWWWALTHTIFPDFIRYPLFNDEGKRIPNQARFDKLPDEFEILIFRFMQNNSVRESYIKTSSDHSQILFLIKFFSCSFHLSENMEVLNWFCNFWHDMNQEMRNSHISFMRSLCTGNNPEDKHYLESLGKLFVFTVSIIPKRIQPWGLALRARDVWKDLFITPNTNVILKSLKENPNLYVVLQSYLGFDFKFSQNEQWMQIQDQSKAEIIIIVRKFTSICAVAFSPLILGLNRDKIDAYVQRIIARDTRNKDGEGASELLKKLGAIFDDPKGFEAGLTAKKQNTMEFNTLQMKTGAQLFPLKADEYTVDEAVAFVLSYIFSFPKVIVPQVLNAFLSTLSLVRDFVPISLQSTPGRIAQTFLQPALNARDFVPYSTEALNAIACAAKQVGVISREGIDPGTCDLWVTTLLRFLCHKEPSVMNSAVPIAIDTIIMFEPHSYVLAYFVLFILANRKVNVASMNGFLISVFSMCGQHTKLVFPAEISADIEAFKESLDNKSIFQETVNMLQGDQNVQELLRNMIMTKVVESNNQMKEEDKNGESWYSTYVALLMIESDAPGKVIQQMFDSSMIGVTKQSCTIDVSRLHMNVRELCILGSLSKKIAKKIPSFPDRFIKIVMSVAKRIKDKADFRRLVQIAAAVALRNLPTCGPLFAKKLETLATQSNRDNILASAESIAGEIVRSSPPPSNDIQQILVIGNKPSAVYGISSPTPDSFVLSSRTDSSFICTKVTAFEAPTVDSIEFPETEETGDEEAGIVIDVAQFFGTHKEIAPIAEVENIDRELNIQIEENNTEENNKQLNVNNSESGPLASMIRLLKDGQTAVAFFNSFVDISSLKVHEGTRIIQRRAAPIFSLPTRECLKIGVIYVAPSQFEQAQILANTHKTASMAFHSFICALGRTVDLTKHQWYNAKLEGSSFSANPYSIYYADSTIEVMFHVSTLLPDDATDAQRILKKKHIGNDNVHIVWCENSYGYDTEVITSQFNDAHIVVFPYSTALYHVVIKKKTNLCVGPLPAECVVTAEGLADLVRATAIVADRAARQSIEVPPQDQFVELTEPIF